MNATRVRYVQIEGNHCKNNNPYSRTVQTKGGECWISVLLPPVAPGNQWKCDTEYVWRVGPDTIRKVGYPEHHEYYVCAHQIEID